MVVVSFWSPRIELDVVGEPEPAQPARLRARHLARREPRHVGLDQRPVEHPPEVPDVVHLPRDAAIGEPLLRDEVAPPELDRVEPEVARRPVHQPLDDVDRLRPPGAAVGVDRRGVGEHPLHREERLLHVVDARHHLQRQLRGDVLAERRVVGPEVRHAADPQRLQPVAPVERRLRHRHMVAPVVVGQHRLAAAAHPVHRPPELARREGDGEILRVVEPLDPEAAADVRRRHPHRLLRQPELVGELVAQRPHPLPREGDGQPPVLPGGGRPPLLHRHRHRPVVDELEPRRVRRRGEDPLDLGLVAERPVVGEVARRLGMDRRPALGGLDVHRQLVPLDAYRLGGVERRRPGLGDHQRHGLAGVADTGLGEDRPHRVGAEAAVAVLHRLEVDRVPELPREVRRGEHRQHPRHRPRLGDLEPAHLGVRRRAAHEDRAGGALGQRVLHVAALPGQEAHVLLARHAAAGPEPAVDTGHSVPLLVGGETSGFRAPVQTRGPFPRPRPTLRTAPDEESRDTDGKDLRRPRRRAGDFRPLGGRGRLPRRRQRQARCRALLHPAAAAERHRQPAHGPRLQPHADGRARPLAPDAGLRRALAARPRPRRHRHADGRRARAGP